MPSTSNLVVGLILVVSMAVLYAVFTRFHRARGTFPHSLEQMIATASANAVERARSRYGVTLDFSLDSIRLVDVLLAHVHQEFVTAPELVDINSLAFGFGSYIGETIRRNQPGCVWERNHDEAGDNSFPLHWGEASCFPIGWCVRRIREGEKESIWSKYELANQMSEKPTSKRRGASV
jgi:hypothetical protein